MKTYLDDSKFSVRWFLNHKNTFETNLQHFRDLPITAVEIGSFEGRSACFMCEEILTHPEAKLICIDPYSYESTEAYAKERLKAQQIVSAYERFQQNTAQYGSKIIHLKLPSHLALRDNIKLAIDFVYVDGSHYGTDCLTDMVLSWTLLKQGGIMAVDDLLWKPPPGVARPRIAAPALAVEFFRQLYQGQFLRLYSTSHQFWIKRTVSNEMLPHNSP